MSYEPDEMMSVAAARAMKDVTACFVGIGLPSTGANLARRTHAPDLVLVYEAGAVGAKPPRLPLSIGDGMLGETADYIAAVPEIFNYWVQPGRIDVGFLGAAQIDRYANINTTVIGGDYLHPKVRLPGAGGAPEIAASCGEVIVIVRQSPRAFVEKVDFITSVGHGSGPGERERLGLRGKGPTKVITDLGILEPDPETKELVLTHRPRGRDRRAGPGGDRLGAEDRRRPADDRTTDRRGAEGVARAGGGMSDAYVLDAVRVPFGRYGGALAGVRPDDLGAHVVKQIVERSDLDPERIDDVMFGNANGAGEDNRNVARMAALLAGLPTTTPGTTINRLCGSSLDAAMQASRAVETGDADLVLVGGVESMSRAPWVVLKPEKGFPAGAQTMHSTTLGWRMVNPEMPDQWTISLGESTEKLAGIHNIGREAQDEFALKSHQRAAAAWDAGHYDELGRAGAGHGACRGTRASAPTPRWRSWPSSSRRS